ncbi:MAG: hypothetical protein HKN23_12725 [Verrucomicrobiales bacterium]|nr:hypothetical protein [Verrucomicrobiales bacterium]
MSEEATSENRHTVSEEETEVKRSSKKHSTGPLSPPPSSENGDEMANGAKRVDQIRDLIFGEMMAGYETRFNALEEKVTQEIESLREQVESALEELKSTTSNQIEDVETNSVPRKEIASSLERLAQSLRNQS